MPRDCTICTNPKLLEIQESIVRQVPYENIASRFGLTDSSISRHSIKHMGRGKTTTRGLNRPGSIRTGKAQQSHSRPDNSRCPQCSQLVGETTEKLSAEEIIKRAERVLFFAESIVTKAQENEDARLALQGVDRCQRSIDTLARIAGLLKSDTQVTINQTTNIYESWATEALFAIQTMHEALASGMTVERALEAVTAQQNGMKKAPALQPGREDAVEAVS